MMHLSLGYEKRFVMTSSCYPHKEVARVRVLRIDGLHRCTALQD